MRTIKLLWSKEVAMKNLVAVAILCSVSTFIGLAGGATITAFQDKANAYDIYEIMKSCEFFKLNDGDVDVAHKLMFLEALNSDSEEARIKFGEYIFERLLIDAIELNREIKENITDSELNMKKELLNEIEGFIKSRSENENS